MNESEFVTKLRDRFLKKNPAGFFYKIPDAKDGQQRPFDGFFILKKGVTAFEAKFSKTLAPWHFKTIEPHQIANLRTIRALGWPAYVVVGVRAITKKFDRKRLPKPLTSVYLDIWIPVDLIPGTGEEILAKKLDIRGLASSLGTELKGSRINEIHLHQRRFEEFVQVVERSVEQV